MNAIKPFGDLQFFLMNVLAGGKVGFYLTSKRSGALFCVNYGADLV